MAVALRGAVIGMLAWSVSAGAGTVYLYKRKSFETRYVFVVADSASARVVRFVSAKGVPRKEADEALPRIDSTGYAGKGGQVRIFDRDRAEFRSGSGDGPLPLRAVPVAELNSLSNRAAFEPQRLTMIHMLKGGLPRRVEAALFYDREAERSGIRKAMESDPPVFDSALAAFQHALLDSVLAGRR